MKKNKMMRVASALLVAVLMTTSVISGTFAKYVTTDSAKDSARVAKWGVELQVEGSLYGDTYANVEVADDATADSIKVQASDHASPGSNVVAPGTNNPNGFYISLKGTPEVDGEITTVIKTQNIYLNAGTYGVMVEIDNTKVTIDATNFEEFNGRLYKLDGKVYTNITEYDPQYNGKYYTLQDVVALTIADNGVYYPVVYKLTGNTNTSETSINSDTLALVATAIANKFGNAEPSTVDGVTTYSFATPYEFDSNTNLATTLKLDNLEINWDWAFEQTDDEETKKMYNGADTILANLMAGGTTSAVVVKTDNKYTTLDVDSDTGLVTYTDNQTTTTVASLKTSFDISITVEQVD